MIEMLTKPKRGGVKLLIYKEVTASFKKKGGPGC